MNSVSGKCINCNGDYEAGCNYCPNCDNCLNNSINKSISLSKPRVSDEVLQIVSVGVRPDNIYEAKMLLAPGVDMTSIKVTVKNKNLRVSVRRPCGEALINSSSIFKKPFLHDAEKIMTKHWGNFLLPDGIDGVKIRAVVDNKRRILQLVAPAINYSKENATILKQDDYIDLKMMSNGVETSIQFTKVPNFYNVNSKECYAAEIKVKGLKIGTAALATENILNIKLHEKEDMRRVRNLNFLFPPNTNAKKVVVEVFQDNTIFLHAPVTKKSS